MTRFSFRGALTILAALPMFLSPAHAADRMVLIEHYTNDQ